VTHQPAISFSISFHSPFNRAGGRTSNVLQNNMRALTALITAFSVPMILLNLLGGIVGGIWLIILGMWSPIGVSLGILFVGSFALGFLLMPSLIFAIPAAKAAERGNTGAAVFIGMFALLYTTILIVAWAFMILKAFAGMGPDAAQWPLMLISYGAATGPWAYMASKEERANPGGVQHSAIHVFFLSAGYIVAMGARLFAAASFETCLWILIITMVIGLILQGIVAAEEHRMRRSYGL
jgi:hypothetical protein